MTPDWVVDVGNSRIKFGQYSPESKCFSSQQAIPHDAEVCQRIIREKRPQRAAIAGVVPDWLDRVEHNCLAVGAAVQRIDSFLKLPLELDVEQPERVGLDRLFDAVAALTLLNDNDPAVVVIDAGTAVTVDLVERPRIFRGGAILPGLRMMARALHQQTALLPEIVPDLYRTPECGRATDQAMQLGIAACGVGGMGWLIRRYRHRYDQDVPVIITGGDGRAIQSALRMDGIEEVTSHPDLTLEGIRIAAEALP